MNCTIIGAGAIGKAVAGYAFSALGADIAFIDAQAAAVADLNARGEYRIYEGKDQWRRVRPVHAVEGGSPEAEACLREADCIVTAVGPGLAGVSAALARALAGDDRPRAVLLFENDVGAKRVLAGAFGGEIPGNLHVYKASIERMSRSCAGEGGGMDVVSEPWIPIILPQEALAACPFLSNAALFTLVPDVEKYYYRKLYTNNLGHAVLGFRGMRAGCRTAREAIGNPEIRAAVRRALDEASGMLAGKYGFDAGEMRAHTEDLIDHRYANPALDDPLERLVRDPARKLSRDERLIGAALGCLECGIEPVEILRTARLAMSGLTMEPERILSEICGIKRHEPLWAVFMNIDFREVDEDGLSNFS